MKLGAITNYPIYQNKFNPISNPVKRDFKQSFLGSEQEVVDSEFLRVYFVSNFNKTNPDVKKYSYNPVSSLEPCYEPLNCDYANIDEFCELYAQKINSQLMKISFQDVENLILRVQQKTQAPKSLVEEVLSKLTHFSNYTSLDRVQEVIDEHSIGDFSASFAVFDADIFDTSSVSALNYLANEKDLLDFAEDANVISGAVILDDAFLSLLERKKNSKDEKERDDYERIFYLLDKGLIKFINIQGWDVKCLDGKYRNANFISGTGYLEDIAVDVISRVQQGEELDDILYSDLSERLKNILECDVEVENVEIDAALASVYDVYNNLSSYEIESDDVKNLIKKYFSHRTVSKEEIGQVLSYLDESTFVFSPDSYALNLVRLHKKIVDHVKKSGLDEKDIAYVVPNYAKSFAYITNVFAKINNINIDNIFGELSPKQWERNEFRAKPKIIIDDISASGATQHKQCEKLECLSHDSDITYACLLTSETAKSLNSDFGTISVHSFKNPARMFDFKKRGIINNTILEHGYRSVCSCCAFPYMIPDSNNDFASILFTKLLYKNTTESNKGLDFVINYHKDFYRDILSTQAADKQ